MIWSWAAGSSVCSPQARIRSSSDQSTVAAGGVGGGHGVRRDQFGVARRPYRLRGARCPGPTGRRTSPSPPSRCVPMRPAPHGRSDRCVAGSAPVFAEQDRPSPGTRRPRVAGPFGTGPTHVGSSEPTTLPSTVIRIGEPAQIGAVTPPHDTQNQPRREAWRVQRKAVRGRTDAADRVRDAHRDQRRRPRGCPPSRAPGRRPRGRSTDACPRATGHASRCRCRVRQPAGRGRGPTPPRRVACCSATRLAAQFAIAHHAPTCADAMTVLHGSGHRPQHLRERSHRAPPRPGPKSVRPASLNGCVLSWSGLFTDTPVIAPGPLLGLVTLARLDGSGWQITRYQPC